MIVASLVYFAYAGLAAVLLPRLSQRRRLQGVGLAAAGLLLTAVTGRAETFWLRLVLLPPLTLLVAYWASGCLWVAPTERMERFLVRSDGQLRIRDVAARVPRVIRESLELAYAGVYPLIPIAFAVHMYFSPRPDAERFWTVILVTDFICFGMLPWIQTRPPRMLEDEPPWRSRVRSFNVRLLRETSICVNTVPSGHAAEALAAALLVTGAPWPVTASMWLAALAVSAGAVLGRYHFALDALAGWAVALAVWLVLGR